MNLGLPFKHFFYLLENLMKMNFVMLGGKTVMVLNFLKKNSSENLVKIKRIKIDFLFASVVISRIQNAISRCSHKGT